MQEESTVEALHGQRLNFWVYQRPSANYRPHLLKPLVESGADERLISALLGADKEAALRIVKTIDPAEWIDRFRQSITSENLIAMVYDRLWTLDLIEPFTDLKTAGNESLLEIVKQEANATAATFAGLDQRVDQLIEWLGGHVVWLKGTALARTLYEKPHFRTSRDFDLLLRPGGEKMLMDCLLDKGFSPVWDTPGLNPRYGIGPVGSLQKLSISPSPEYVFFDNLLFKQEGWPYLELKTDPLDNGLRMRELYRFFADCEHVDWHGQNFLAPSTVDHLVLQLTHLHKHGFAGWHWLYDIHLLAGKLGGNEALWQEFVRRCLHEQVESSAWAGLTVVADRLQSPVPAEVLRRLAPKGPAWATNFVMFTVSTEFIWNTATLPELLRNALFVGDRKRKLKTLRETILPSQEFLSDYYAGGKALSPLLVPLVWLLHLLVLLLPGGAVRRTFGQHLWKYRPATEEQGNKISSPTRMTY